MLGDTTTSVSSSVNPGGGGGGGATANTHHHQYQSHHNQNPPSISSSAAIGCGLIQEGIGEAGGGGGSGAGHVGSSSGGEEDRVGSGDRSFGGNRWPRQETLALLKIRTDMDATFRDASVKGPLWEDVSRKLGELGYHRSAKKCKEKFENVYKYHKRTKDGRVGKHEGKTYRYFEQLEAFETHPPGGAPPPPQPPPQPLLQLQMPTTSNPPQTQPALVVASHISTVPSTTVATAASIIPPPQQQAPINTTTTAPPFVSPPPQLTNFPVYQPPSFPTFSADLMSNSTSTSSTSSDVELRGRHKRKRKWKDFFGRLMTEVVQKQEEMQRKFLEAIEKREQERMAKEESWRLQELSRINREREILAQERSIAAAKDAAVMSFLQKLSEQQAPGAPPLQLPQAIVQSTPAPPQQPPTTTAPPPPPPTQVPAPPPQSQSTPTPVQSTAPATPAMTTPSPAAAAMTTPLPAQQHHQLQQQQPGSQIIQMAAGGMRTMDSEGDRNYLPASSSRWPKVEVEALISLRTNLDSKYQENGPKGPLWEEISAGMKRLGYNRSSKRCKEKWENINKYFKKVKESNRKRPEDSKTCPYFHQLDALYRHKSEGASSSTPNLGLGQQFSLNSSTLPLMVQPEQQWPPPPPPPQPAHHQEHRPDLVMHDMDSEDEEDEEDEEDDDDDDEGGGGGYELVSNKMNTGGQ